MESRKTTKMALGAASREELVQHLRNCMGARSPEAAAKALAWLHRTLGASETTIFQVSRSGSPQIMLAMQASHDGSGVAERSLSRTTNITASSLVALTRSNSAPWWKASKSPSLESFSYAENLARQLNEFIYIPPATRKYASADSVIACAILTEKPQVEDAEKHLVSVLVPAIRTAIFGQLGSTPLSARELEVLRWSVRGKSAGEIGQLLSIPEAAVEELFSAIRRKLGIATHVQALSHAASQGWL